jgi:hypothetical protein
MAAPTSIALAFSPQARAKIDAFLARITEYPPTLCIMKGRTLPETDDKWTYGAYGPDNLKALAPDYERLGKPLLYAVDGLSVAIPQYQLVHELEGKVLELGDGCLIVRDGNAAI